MVFQENGLSQPLWLGLALFNPFDERVDVVAKGATRCAAAYPGPEFKDLVQPARTSCPRTWRSALAKLEHLVQLDRPRRLSLLELGQGGAAGLGRRLDRSRCSSAARC